jgi:exonuclease SbcD
MVKILHFADAHIDLARQGRHDAESGLPLRVLDFLKSLDTIVDTAVEERVDLVIFAGDAYRDRTPAPTYQREWGKRIMRLSSAGIQTLLVLGNHDLSPAAGRAHALQEFETLQVPNIRVISKPCLLSPDQLNGLPMQVIGLPWLNRSALAAALASGNGAEQNPNSNLTGNPNEIVKKYLQELDPQFPAVLAAHATVQGAVYGNERSVMLGRDLILEGDVVRDPRLDYVALGHIHKSQDLNPHGYPHVVYPGSIERVDFGEIKDDKTFVIVQLEKGKTTFEQRKLSGRKFIDRSVSLTEKDHAQEQIMEKLPPESKLQDAIFRLVIDYPHDWEALIDEIAIRRKTEGAFEFHLIRRPHIQARLRLPKDQTIASIRPLDLLPLYWKAVGNHQSKDDEKEINRLAAEIMQFVESGGMVEESE